MASLPLEDTAEVKAAKEAFATVYKTVEAGDHINMMPVNNDVQAPQIANSYLDDTMDVAKAKEAFMASFRNVEAGGLEAMQAPAPVHEMPKIVAPSVAPVAVYNSLPYHHMAYNTFAYNHVLPTTLQKVNIPATYAVPHTYAYAHPYAYTYPYVMPAVQAVEKMEPETSEAVVEMA